MSKARNHIKCTDPKWEGRADCRHCPIRKFDIFAEVNLDKYEDLLKRIVLYDYAKKSMLYVENSPAIEMYIVRNGLLKLEETLGDGSTRIVRLVRKGGIAGLETFLNNGQCYEQTAIALKDTEVCKIPFPVINGILTSDPGFYKFVLKEWQKQMEASSRVIVEFSTGTLRQRCARVLLMLIDEANHEAKIGIEIMSLNDFAALTGVTRESVSRILSEFKRNKLLIKDDIHKMRFDEAGLREIAEHYTE
jgi:CRP-like cAMP-binding protein